jgi:hypothetical protein
VAITLYSESISIDSVVLHWIDAVDPGDVFEIYRSEDGSNFDLIDTTAAGAEDYEDSGLEDTTRYWYKVANESAVESNESSVITQTCFGLSVALEPAAALPTADGDVTDEQFNDAMRRLESIVRNQSDGHDCVACSADGALVLNCAEGCRDFNVEVTEDINSISIIGCEDAGDGNINFRIPADTTRRICGFPSNIGMSVGACWQAPLAGGSNGRTVSIGFCGSSEGTRAKTPSGTGGSGTSAGGGGVGGGGTLTLTCLTDAGAPNNNCSLACGSTKAMRYRASGGRPPYTFSTNSGGTVTTVNTNTRRIVPPSNPGSGVSGTAYVLKVNAQFTSGSSCEVVACHSNRSCNDVELSTTGGGNGCGTCNGTPAPIDSGDCTGTTLPLTGNCGDVPCTACTRTNLGAGPCDPRTGCVEDLRTAGMITDGCVPCGLMATKTVTVTDAAGTSVSKTIRF